jgi:hypothetical protein
MHDPEVAFFSSGSSPRLAFEKTVIVKKNIAHMQVEEASHDVEFL